MQQDEQQKPPANPQGVPQPVSPVVPGSTGIARERDNIRPTTGGPELTPDLKKIGLETSPDLDGVPPTSLGSQIRSNQGAVIPPATGISGEKPITEEPEVSESVFLTEEEEKEALKEKRGQIIPFGGGNKSRIYEATAMEREEKKAA